MAGNFMTNLLALLGNDKYMKDVPRQASDGTGKGDIKNCLDLVEKILNQTSPIAGNTQLKVDQGQSNSSTFLDKGISDHLSSTIKKLCCQITCEAQHSNDVERIMASLLEKLSSFSWMAKAVLTLSAFSVYYAENYRLAQMEKSDNLLSLTARLIGFRVFGNSSNAERADAFVKLDSLIKQTLKITKYIVEHVNPLRATTDDLACFKYIIVTVLGCSFQFSGLINASNEFLSPDWLTFSNRVKKRYASFRKQFLCKEIKRVTEDPTDIVDLIKVLICSEDDSGDFHNGRLKKMVTVEYFKDKSVLLLISDLILSGRDLAVLASIYNASAFLSNNYEILWVPIVKERNKVTEGQFLQKRSQTLWCTYNSMISEIAADFIEEEWQYRQQTKVVTLNRQGEVVNMDAMTMIRLWGWEAFPFTETKGIELWNGKWMNWLQLVFSNVEKSIQGKELIFFYGSAEDFKIVQNVKSHLSKIQSSVSVKFIIFPASDQFLSRLESCMSLMMQAEWAVNDSRTKELSKLYTMYKQQGGFGILAKGSSVVVNARLTDFEMVLSQHQNWINKITKTETFENVFKAYYEKNVLQPRCHHFSIPNNGGKIPKSIKCTECPGYMKSTVTFECCHDEHEH